MKNYPAQTPQNLALTKIEQNVRKTNTPQRLARRGLLREHFSPYNGKMGPQPIMDIFSPHKSKTHY